MEARTRSRMIGLGTVVLLVALLVVDQTRLTLGYARHWVNEDHTLLWYAGRDLGHGRLLQPTFYGESYFTVFDAMPAELLRRAGVGIAAALAMSEAALNIGGWPLLAFVAWRRHHRVLAAAAIAAPVVVSFEFLVASEKGSGGGAGVFLAMVGVAVLLASPERARNVGIFFALGSLGAAWNNSMLYLVAPAGVYAVFVNARAARTWVAALVGILPGVAWFAYVHEFIRQHPDYNFAGRVGYRPSLSNLSRSLPHVGRYFGWEAPELWRWVGVPLAAIAVVLVALVWTMRWRAVLAGLAFVVLVVGTLATRKVFDGTPSAYLGFGRYFLAVPAAVWLLTYVAVETRPPPRPAWASTNVLLVAVFAVAGVSFVGRNLTFDTRLAHITQVAQLPSAGAPISTASSVVVRCEEVVAAARRAETAVVVYRYDRTGAYGCGALEYGRLETMFPVYDRRTWILHREDRVMRTSFIADGVNGAWCADARRLAVVRSCTLDPVVPTLAVVRTVPAPVITVWRDLGERVRALDVKPV